MEEAKPIEITSVSAAPTNTTNPIVVKSDLRTKASNFSRADNLINSDEGVEPMREAQSKRTRLDESNRYSTRPSRSYGEQKTSKL